MSREIGPTVEVLMRRVRQEGGLMVSVDFATEVYSRCEQVTNIALRSVVSTTTLTTVAQKLLYNFREEISDAASISHITESNRSLFHCSKLEEFAAFEQNWFRNITGTRFEAWHQIGRDILILYPAKAAASSVSIDYTPILTLYQDFAIAYNISSSLPDEDVDFALQLAELVLLLRSRLLPAFSARLQSFVNFAKAKGVDRKWIETMLKH